MFTSKAVTTSLRLSRAEVNLICPGLRRILAAHAAWDREGKAPFSFERLIYSAIRDDEGQYSPADMDTIRRVLEKLADGPGETKRFHLDAFELAAASLGVRATEKMSRHRHIQGSFPNHQAAARRLLSKLERHRKRAKRSFIRVQGLTAFSAASQRWQRFVLFVRAHFLYCSCHRPLLPGIHPRIRRRQLVELWMKCLREDLPAAGIEVPPDDQLRELVKRALRSDDRFVRSYGLGVVRANPGLFRERMWKFVTSRCSEQT